MGKQVSVHSDKAPAAVGPYSQAILAGEMLFCSGQIPLDPSTGEIIPGGIEAQTHQVMKNLANVLEAAGVGFGQVLKTTILLSDMADFKVVNQVYASYLQEPFPARATFQVAGLPLGALVEIEAVAKVSKV